MYYKLALAGLAGALIGAGIATYVCYNKWYKFQTKLLDEIGQAWDEVHELNEKNLELERDNEALSEHSRELGYQVQNLKESIDTMSEPVIENVPDEDRALCEEDGPEEVPVNKCPNPRFTIGTDEDVIEYWNGIYGEIEVYRDPYGSLYTEDSYGYHKAFYPDQLGGTGNLIACIANGLYTVLDNARGVVFHIHQIHEEDDEPDVYENELDDVYMY